MSQQNNSNNQEFVRGALVGAGVTLATVALAVLGKKYFSKNAIAAAKKSNSLHPVSVDDFRNQGKQLIDTMADYYEKVETYPVISQVQPGYLKKLIPEKPPKGMMIFLKFC